MKLYRHGSFTSMLIVAFVISLIINFSYLMLYVVDQSEYYSRPVTRSEQKKVEKVETWGRLSLNVDGFGYIITDAGDSIYVGRSTLRRLPLEDGDILRVEASTQPNMENAHLAMTRLLARNGRQFDYATVYDSPKQTRETLYQIIYYMLLSLIILMVVNGNKKSADDVASWQRFAKRAVVATIIVVVGYFLAPLTLPSGQMVMLYQSVRILNFMIMLKCLFVLAVVLLYSRVYALTYQSQVMALENEQLKNENLTTRYNMLVSQINPHFFFNSLNSLSMLVREGDEKRALEYIDQLSYTFRYITQNSNNTEMVQLGDELRFAEAYCYLYRIRYADKIFFDVDIEPAYMDWCLPALSLQPLIGNAVKHNAITAKNPFHVRIYTEDGFLVVANKRLPLLEPQIGTGTGLQNLDNRYQLLVGRGIEILAGEQEFVVRLPLEKSVTKHV